MDCVDKMGRKWEMWFVVGGFEYIGCNEYFFGWWFGGCKLGKIGVFVCRVKWNGIGGSLGER